MDLAEPANRELLKQTPTMPATVIAGRIGWERGLTIIMEWVRELRPAHLPVDPVSRPQVRPLTWSERMPTWSAKSTSPPSAFALARIAGHASSRQTRTASWSCSTALLSGRWNEGPSGAHTCQPLLGQAHPVQLRDQVPHPGPRPQLPGQTQITGTVLQHGLPDRLLLDRIEKLMFADPTSTLLGYKRLPPAGQPLRPPVVHRLERDLEHHRNILASPARHQRGHRPQTKGFPCRRRQLPYVPRQFTHAGINDPEHLPFRINRRATLARNRFE